MRDLKSKRASTNNALPVAPSMEPALEAARVPTAAKIVDARIVLLCGLSVLIAIAAGVVAQMLTALIGMITNLAFFGRLSTALVSPADAHLGWWVVVVPAAGGVIVGLMARYGSKAIRGHGIPEAMEGVVAKESRIPPRLTFLKPLSAAIAIGTGGPFGAEGPIIATGGALGSLVGQVLRTTAAERKTLLAAGAAAGMAAIFGSPVAAVLLAVELLLFEFRPRSIIPVALASATAAAVRMAFDGSRPFFEVPHMVQPSATALAMYIVLGGLVGVGSVVVTKTVYACEDAFERLPIHWMWWPAIGGLAVGLVGYISPETLGVGYRVIENALAGKFTLGAAAALCALKLVSWAMSIGSGTSGGELAPLFIMGGTLGAAFGGLALMVFPDVGFDIRMAALVGMAAMFAGASRAVLTSVVFAFEVTQQPIELLPLLGGCATAYFVSYAMMRHSLMTEKIARRGKRVLGEYSADFLDQVLVGERATFQLVSLEASQLVAQVRAWLESGGEGTAHQGFPVVDSHHVLQGVLTRRDLLSGSPDRSLGELIGRPPAIIFEDHSLREAADHMVREGVGRLVVVSREDPRRPIGMLTRSDIIGAHQKRLDEDQVAERTLEIHLPHGIHIPRLH